MKRIFSSLALSFTLSFAFSIAFLSIGSLHAQPTQEFAETLTGSWVGTGTLFTQEADFSMSWESKLNGQFLMLQFKNEFTDKSGTKHQMLANAYYSFKQNKGHWFDSRGTMLPLSLEIIERKLTVLWGRCQYRTRENRICFIK